MSSMEEVFEDAVKMIRKYGVQITAVFPTEKLPGVDFAYTSGLALQDHHPELIIFGLPPKVAHSILNEMAFKVIHEDWTWTPGKSEDVFGGGVPAWLIEVPDSREHLTMANTMFAEDGVPLPALQVMYPDAEGLWPWEPDSQLSSLPTLGDVSL